MSNIFNIDDSVEEIERKINNAQGVVPTIQTGLAFLQHKLQKKLVEDQNEYNRKQLWWSRAVALATILLAVATIALVIVTWFLVRTE